MVEETSPNHDLDEYLASSTTIVFDRPLPLLRGPVRSGPAGPYVLAFRDGAAWKSAFRACESRIGEQCEAAARIGCAMAASSKCRPPWWRSLVGLGAPDFKERERCEEREMEGCLAAAKDKCSGFAAEKCLRSFREARVSSAAAAATSGAEKLVCFATVMDKKGLWIDLIGLGSSRRGFGLTTRKACDLIGRSPDVDCVLGGYSENGKLKA